MPDFLLPELGEGLTEAEIITWLVEVGDTISIDQPVVEVETAKAMVEVPSLYAGVVSARHGKAGETLAVGSVLISVGEDANLTRKGVAEPGVVVPEQSGAAEEGSGNVLIGYGTSAAPRRKRRSRTQAQQPQPQPQRRDHRRSRWRAALPQ